MKSRNELHRKPRALIGAMCALVLAPLLASSQEATFQVELTGPEASGDPDGRGEATVTLHPDENRVDVHLTYSNIAKPTALFLRRGPTGLDGNVVMPIVIESDDGSTIAGQRVSAMPGVVATIAASPSDYYLVVMNEEYPVGALRGQLRE